MTGVRMERERGVIERGKVIEVAESGYRIASLDRDGIETPPIKPIESGQGITPVYAVGDKVYYFFFHDGTGRIICAI